MARVKTQLRRYKQYDANQTAPAESEAYDRGGLYLCLNSRQCTLNGEPLPLTPTEFNIMEKSCYTEKAVLENSGYCLEYANNVCKPGTKEKSEKWQ